MHGEEVKKLLWTALVVLTLSLVGAAYMFRYTPMQVGFGGATPVMAQVWDRWMQRPCVFFAEIEPEGVRFRRCMVRDTGEGWIFAP